jgi:hypothetical protein
MSEVALIQGFLSLKEGKGWKNHYFMLSSDGNLSMSAKKGGKVAKTFHVTNHSQVSLLHTGDNASQFSLTGANHDPLVFQAPENAVAEGWVRALQIMRKGGPQAAKAPGGLRNTTMLKTDAMQAAYAKKGALEGSGKTLGRAKQQGSTPDLLKSDSERSLDNLLDDVPDMRASVNVDMPPPPPPEDEHVHHQDEPPPPARATGGSGSASRSAGGSGAASRAAGGSGAASRKSEKAPPPPPAVHRKGSAPEQHRATEPPPAASEGMTVHIGHTDVYLDMVRWEYYADKNAFLRGAKPLGHATLTLLV